MWYADMDPLFSSFYQGGQPTSRFRKWQQKIQPYITLSTGIRLRLSIAGDDLLGKTVSLVYYNFFLIGLFLLSCLGKLVFHLWMLYLKLFIP